MLIDSHVNLHSERYENDVDAVIERARDAGVDIMLTISDRLSSSEAIKEIIDADPKIWRSIGVHPHHAKDYANLSADELVRLAAEDDKIVGIGECGLDFYYEYSDRDIQAAVFAAHIEAAQRTELPLIIHTRDADEEMASALSQAFQSEPFTPLLHCYTGGPALAKTVLAMGGYISFSGIITFKNASDVREIAASTPLDRIIIETDCPYLAPAPMRGRRNEPAYLVHVAEKLAEIVGKSADDIAAITTDNFLKLFSKIDDPRAS